MHRTNDVDRSGILYRPSSRPAFTTAALPVWSTTGARHHGRNAIASLDNGSTFLSVKIRRAHMCFTKVLNGSSSPSRGTGIQSGRASSKIFPSRIQDPRHTTWMMMTSAMRAMTVNASRSVPFSRVAAAPNIPPTVTPFRRVMRASWPTSHPLSASALCAFTRTLESSACSTPKTNTTSGPR